MPTRDTSATVLPAVEANGIYTTVAPDYPYIWPDVTLDDELEPTPLVLLAAPGAMGKTAAAKNLAANIAAIYVDLSRLRVGSGSLTGELTKALGFDAVGAFVADLKQGKASIILDSTDEAQLGAGRDNYGAFLDDLLWLLVDAEPKRQVALLGRHDATETSVLTLLDVGMKAPVYKLAPLSWEQACDLIDVTLDQKMISGVAYQVHRKHPIPFGQLRDHLLNGIGHALQPNLGDAIANWERVDDFLGYPPVLSALAERLAVENPGAETSAGDTFGGRRERGALLRGILEKILDREQEKVRTRVGDSLGMAVDSPERNVLYGRDEQVSRLLSATGTTNIGLDVPASLDDYDRGKYEESIESFFADHPFIKGDHFANVVFQDYARAWAIASSVSYMYATSRAQFLSTLPTPGPFFAHFLQALGASEEHVARIPEDLVDDAIKSFALGSERSTSVYVQHNETAVLVLAEEGGKDLNSNVLSFGVDELSGVLTLRSPLSRATIVTDSALVLRGHKGRLDLGPLVSIIAPEIEIDATSLNVQGLLEGGRYAGASVISANEVHHDNELRITSVPTGSLAVSWPDHWHQWNPYVVELNLRDSRVDNQTASQVLVAIRRIITSFRGSMKDDPSVSSDKIDRIVVGTNPVFLATLSSLLEMGVVSRNGALTRLHLDKLSEFKLSWSDLRGDDPIESLKPILKRVIETKTFKSYLG